MDIQSMSKNASEYRDYFNWCAETLELISPQVLETACDEYGLIDSKKFPEHLQNLIYSHENPLCQLFPNPMDAFLFAIGADLVAYQPPTRVLFKK